MLWRFPDKPSRRPHQAVPACCGLTSVSRLRQRVGGPLWRGNKAPCPEVRDQLNAILRVGRTTSAVGLVISSFGQSTNTSIIVWWTYCAYAVRCTRANCDTIRQSSPRSSVWSWCAVDQSLSNSNSVRSWNSTSGRTAMETRVRRSPWSPAGRNSVIWKRVFRKDLLHPLSSDSPVRPSLFGPRGV